LLLLFGRFLLAFLRVLYEDNPQEIQAEHVGLWSLIIAQVAGTGAWLVRGLLDTHHVGKLIGLVGMPLVLWGGGRLMFRQWVAKDELTFKSEKEGLGKESRRCLRLLLLHTALIVEQSCVMGYVIGVLPPAFARDYLFFDWAKCIIFTLSMTLSTAAILSLWTVHLHLTEFQSLWCLLGMWVPYVPSSKIQVQPWDSLRTYLLFFSFFFFSSSFL
jgi:hypothetical protein